VAAALNYLTKFHSTRFFASLWWLGVAEWFTFSGIFCYRLLFGAAPFGLLDLQRGNSLRERVVVLWRASVCSMLPAMVGIAAAVDTGQVALDYQHGPEWVRFFIIFLFVLGFAWAVLSTPWFITRVVFGGQWFTDVENSVLMAPMALIAMQYMSLPQDSAPFGKHADVVLMVAMGVNALPVLIAQPWLQDPRRKFSPAEAGWTHPVAAITCAFAEYVHWNGAELSVEKGGGWKPWVVITQVVMVYSTLTCALVLARYTLAVVRAVCDACGLSTRWYYCLSSPMCAGARSDGAANV